MTRARAKKKKQSARAMRPKTWRESNKNKRRETRESFSRKRKGPEDEGPTNKGEN
jgi:hypothetical protein